MIGYLYLIRSDYEHNMTSEKIQGNQAPSRHFYSIFFSHDTEFSVGMKSDPWQIESFPPFPLWEIIFFRSANLFSLTFLAFAPYVKLFGSVIQLLFAFLSPFGRWRSWWHWWQIKDGRLCAAEIRKKLQLAQANSK